ncbi:MAG: glycosyltransferase, partial [Lacipirellulaceae bacterium]
LCDVVVHCSVAPEPFGRVIVEAMLSKRPVIASDDGGAREIVLNGVNGLVFPPGDSTALASAIGRLLADRELANGLALAGYESAIGRYRLDDRVAEVNELIERVALRDRPRQPGP